MSLIIGNYLFRLLLEHGYLVGPMGNYIVSREISTFQKRTSNLKLGITYPYVNSGPLHSFPADVLLNTGATCGLLRV